MSVALFTKVELAPVAVEVERCTSVKPLIEAVRCRADILTDTALLDVLAHNILELLVVDGSRRVTACQSCTIAIISTHTSKTEKASW